MKFTTRTRSYGDQSGVMTGRARRSDGARDGLRDVIYRRVSQPVQVALVRRRDVRQRVLDDDGGVVRGVLVEGN